jgi:hypothetical protein
MRVRIIVILGLCLAGSGARARADGIRYDWRVEDGAEYDTNPARAETIAGTPSYPTAPASPLARVVASGNLATPLGESNFLALSGAFGGKWFLADEARPENVLVAQTSASDSLRLLDRTHLALAAAYYDVFQRRSTDLPDFRSLAPSLRFDQGIAKASLASLGGGYRWFTFKSDDAYSFVAPTAFVALKYGLPANSLDSGADWEWNARASVELRDFQGPACSSTGCADAAGTARHHDRFWIGQVEFTRTGSWLFGSGVALHANQSSSFGESLVRGLVHVRAVVPLPWEISLSVRGELVATHYADPLTFSQPVAALPGASMEDESRSTLRVELARIFDSQFEIGARYVYYTSAPTSGAVEYRRQTFLIYLAFLDEH